MITNELKVTLDARRATDFAPARVLEIEIGRRLPAIQAADEKTGICYQRAYCLIRLHTHPIGVVEIPLAANEVPPAEYGSYIWAACGTAINHHLLADNLHPICDLDADGVPSHDPPPCLIEREQIRAKAPFVSVVVPTRDRPELLWRCLQSLLALDYPDYEILVVDNAPTTSVTADLIRQFAREASQVRYLREDHPGAARARTCGLQAARGEFIAFADDDVMVDRWWLMELVKGFTLAENVACVTGLILPLELDTPAQAWVEAYGGFGKGFERKCFDMGKHRLRHPLYPYIAGSFGSGASMAFRTTFLRSIGGFDPALANGEDIAAFFQVVHSGQTVVYEPSALLYHQHYREYASLRRQIRAYGSGLTAYLTKSMCDDPRVFFAILTRIPYGLYFILSPCSPKNSKKAGGFPRELARLEYQGMLCGPLAYLRRRWQLRHERGGAGELPNIMNL